MKRMNHDTLKISIISVMALLFIAFGLLLLQKWESDRRYYPAHAEIEKTVEYNGIQYVLKENIETFLLIGLDKFDDVSVPESYNNDQQADFLMLFVFDHDTKQYSAIHINRDTMVDVDVLGIAGNRVNTITQQIALSHTYGNGKEVSCYNTANSVTALLNGMKVNHFVSVTMDAVSILNDSVGGVELAVLHDFSGVDDALVKGETVTLMGEQALTYVRARKDIEDSSNQTRMQRQKQYVEAFLAAYEARAEHDPTWAIEASAKLSNYVVSDLSVSKLQAMMNKFREYEFLGIQDIKGESVRAENFMEFYPNTESIQRIVINMFYCPMK